jgi:hypothetical protein
LGVLPKNFLPQGVDHGKAEKLSLPEENFRSPSLSKELAGPFLWVLPKKI